MDIKIKEFERFLLAQESMSPLVGGDRTILIGDSQAETRGSRGIHADCQLTLINVDHAVLLLSQDFLNWKSHYQLVTDERKFVGSTISLTDILSYQLKHEIQLSRRLFDGPADGYRRRCKLVSRKEVSKRSSA